MSFPSREQILQRLRVYFAHRRWPRLMMSLVLSFTGLAGFFASYLMLAAGLEEMSLRYPLATLIAWAVLLGLMRLWVEMERRALPPEADPTELFAGEDPAENTEKRVSRDFSDWLEFPDIFAVDADEGCFPLFLLLFAVLFLFFAVVGVLTIIVSAPVLLAEVFLDAVLVTALYKRLRNIDRRWWVTTVLRQTWKAATCTALLMMLLGLLMQTIVPGAKSIGGVIEHARRE